MCDRQTDIQTGKERDGERMSERAGGRENDKDGGGGEGGRWTHFTLTFTLIPSILKKEVEEGARVRIASKGRPLFI